MRVSTAQIYNTGTIGIQRNQGTLYTLQNQIATGRRVLTPGDDPIASSQALLTTQASAVNTQHEDNQAAARTQLNLVESKLGSIVLELQNVLERTVAAGSAALSDQQRGMIAQDLRGKLENLVGIANSQDGNGLYIFSGFQGQAVPFALSGNASPHTAATPYFNYQGDEGQRKLQVSPSQEMAITETGSDIFVRVRDGQGNLTGKGMFDTIQNLANLLDPASSPAFNTADYNDSLNEINATIAHISKVRTSVGARLASLDSLTSLSEDLKLQYDQRLSELQDLDYAKAISDFTLQQVQLEAAQKTFKQTAQLNIFNYL